MPVVAFRGVVALAALIYAAGVWALHTFVADDAYIVSRYVENLVDFGALEFNLGEPVLALTSPLHAGVATVLYALTGSSLTSYKVLSVALVLTAFALIWRQLSDSDGARSIALVVIVLSPCVVLWTFGGLETPLLLFLATALVFAAYDDEVPGRLYLIFVLAGLCFLTRYDAVLFAAPIVACATVRAREPKRVLLAALVGAALPLAWLAGAWRYYDSILPTSFFVKMPAAQEVELGQNASYLLLYLSVVGLLPFFLLFVVEGGRRRALGSVLKARAGRHWGLYLGVLAMVGYGLWVATTHMLFSFRYFVPYLPAATLVIADLHREHLATIGVHSQRRLVENRVVYLALVLVLFQGYQLAYTYRRSLNGVVGIGEYPEMGSKAYERGMLATRVAIANDIRRHWQDLGRDDAPKIFTTAGGVLPYSYREAYFLERLVSYRHECTYERAALGAFADYVHFVSPRHGTVATRLAKPVDRYELVSSRYVVYDGVLESFVVYFDPNPEASPLPPRVSDRCGTGS